MFRSNAAFLLLGLGDFSFIHGHASHHRRRLSPNASIINALHEQMSEGIAHPRFTLTAQYEVQGGGLFASPEPFEIDVMLTNPSVAETTSFSVDGGPRASVQSTSKFFIADSDHELSKEFAILAVDEDRGLVSGLVQKDGKLLKLEQRLGGPTFVTDARAFDPPKDWECTVAHDAPAHVAKEEPPGSDGGRRRVEESHEHEHDRSHHSHENEHSHHVHTLNLSSSSDSIFSQVTNIDPNMLHNRRRLYQTDDFPLKWSYQVDLYIEIDGALIDKHDTDKVNMPNTINYVNALITAASSVYEKEVDTHLHVLHIAKTTIYDSQTTTSGALDVMMSQYSNANGWHYTDSETGQTPDLHHAILYRNLGGGVAYVGAICNSQYGYGVSAGVRGSMQDIGGEMFWDLSVIMHELGHNFGSSHTHNIDAYNPKVDACGDGQCTSLIDGGALQSGEATIMSYCHLCSGGGPNIGATFGGHWNGGDRSNVNNWLSDDGVKTWSQDARRVPKTMYEHVSSRSCVEPYLTVPSQLCTIDSDCDTGNSCKIGRCDPISGACSVETIDGCCGNGKCEAGENGSNCSADCIPVTLPTPTCQSCWIPYSAMFDIEAINDIDITSISFLLYGGSSSIKIYTAPQSYSNIATSANSWTLIVSGTVTTSDWVNINADIDDIPLSAGAKRAFYIVTSGRLAISDDSNTPLAADNNLKLLNPTRMSYSTSEFGSASSGEYSWVGSITYTPNGGNAAPVTSSPSKKPSTSSPTRKPISSKPTNLPTISPTTSGAAGFTKMNTAGYCRDASGQWYAGFMSSALSLSTTNDDYCLNWCGKLKRSDLVAVEVYRDTDAYCFCDFSGGNVPNDINVSSFDPPASGVVTYSGDGAVTSTDSVTGAVCYKNDNFQQVTQAPTRRPTVAPSRKPTQNPTKRPTTEPTSAPTRRPTLAPSRKPTQNPTKKPTTSAPTENPTRKPSQNPTRVPSRMPTTEPQTTATQNPTSKPTQNPTRSPSGKPTAEPSNAPTRRPAAPSRQPSQNPTRKPTTAAPTQNPTRKPSQNPTRSPSGNPTAEPTTTQNPTISKSPSQNPTTSTSPTTTSAPTKMPITSRPTFAKTAKLSKRL